ncbi:MAG: radical SAM protein, partial [Oscillospiraceae bacterium]|nr:radical SAM protein [Oscillospiraceae bacterium]
MNILRRTRSVCPVCLSPLEATLTERDGIIYQEKNCPEHGAFSAPVWHGKIDMALWRRGVPELGDGEGTGCPGSCGI